MSMRLVWTWLVGFVCGAFFLAFVVYPPVKGWGESFQWDKLANWLSAIGSAGAAVAAVWIATSDARRRSREDRRIKATNATLTAAEMVPGMASLRIQIVYARGVIKTAREQDSVTNMLAAVREVKIDAMKSFPRGPELRNLPNEFAISLATALSTIDGVNAVLDEVRSSNPEYVNVEFIRHMLGLDALFDATQLRLAGVVKILGTYGAMLKVEKFLDRGDGTIVGQ